MFLGGRPRSAGVLAGCYLNAGSFLDVVEASRFCCFWSSLSRLSDEVKTMLLIWRHPRFDFLATGAAAFKS